jgi:hypothetical protein
MNDYILIMHDDATDRDGQHGKNWPEYLSTLRQSGEFGGGSSIGPGECVQKGMAPRPASGALTGYLRVRAESLEGAKRFLVGNPVYEAGGTVEVRELPRD